MRKMNLSKLPVLDWTWRYEGCTLLFPFVFLFFGVYFSRWPHRHGRVHSLLLLPPPPLLRRALKSFCAFSGRKRGKLLRMIPLGLAQKSRRWMNGQSERASVVVYIWSMTSVAKTQMLSMIERRFLVVMALLSLETYASGDVDNCVLWVSFMEVARVSTARGSYSCVLDMA
jgi:hypothetical protein